MATSPVPQWAREMSPHRTEPTIAGTLALFAVVALVLLALLGQPASTGTKEPYREPPPCATVWPPTCEAPKGR
jgi:hypothetical protein